MDIKKIKIFYCPKEFKLREKCIEKHCTVEVQAKCWESTLKDSANAFLIKALECDHIQSEYINNFTVNQLKELAEKAKKNNLLLTLSAEHSNACQGVLINLVRKDKVKEFFKYF